VPTAGRSCGPVGRWPLLTPPFPCSPLPIAQTAVFHQQYWLRKKLAYLGCIAECGLLTARCIRHITSLSSWRPASAEHREPIVPRTVRRNASRSPRVRRGACQAHRRNRLLHAYCNRIQMFSCSSEAWKAEVTKGLVRPPRCRACWRQMVATLWGGECCAGCACSWTDFRHTITLFFYDVLLR
jgi:hypothetical protein